MLAILTTHPIQYQAPIWQALARRGTVPFEVWYLSRHGLEESLDAEFGRSFRWDLDLLAGHPHRFLATRPERGDVQRFRGLTIAGLAPLLQEAGVRALWVNGWQVQGYWQAAFAAHRLGIPVWLRGDSNDLSRRSRVRHLVRKAALGQLFRRTSKVLYVGSANRRLYREMGVPDEKLVFTPHCVDNERFSRFADEWAPRRDELRRAWGIPEGAFCFLFCGKLVERKRPADLLDAFRLLLEADREAGAAGRVHLLLVGTGALKPELEAQAARLRELCGRDVVTFAGFLNQTEVPRAYVAADCLVLPSNFLETWGLVVNEALACGTPALVSDQCGCAEDLARPLGPGMVFPFGDVGRLAECMAERVHDPSPGRLREAARTLIASYGIGQVVSAVEQAYAVLRDGRSETVERPCPGSP